MVLDGLLKKKIDKNEELTGYLLSSTGKLDFSLYKEFHYLIAMAHSRQNIVRSITHTWFFSDSNS